MNIDNLTVGEFKSLSKLIGEPRNETGLNSHLGEKVIVRT